MSILPVTAFTLDAIHNSTALIDQIHSDFCAQAIKEQDADTVVGNGDLSKKIRHAVIDSLAWHQMSPTSHNTALERDVKRQLGTSCNFYSFNAMSLALIRDTLLFLRSNKTLSKEAQQSLLELVRGLYLAVNTAKVMTDYKEIAQRNENEAQMPSQEKQKRLLKLASQHENCFKAMLQELKNGNLREMLYLGSVSYNLGDHAVLLSIGVNSAGYYLKYYDTEASFHKINDKSCCWTTGSTAYEHIFEGITEADLQKSTNGLLAMSVKADYTNVGEYLQTLFPANKINTGRRFHVQKESICSFSTVAKYVHGLLNKRCDDESSGDPAGELAYLQWRSALLKRRMVELQCGMSFQLHTVKRHSSWKTAFQPKEMHGITTVGLPPLDPQDKQGVALLKAVIFKQQKVQDKADSLAKKMAGKALDHKAGDKG